MLIICPSCQKQLRVPDTAAGKKVRCPSCTSVIEAGAAPEQIQAHPPPLPAVVAEPMPPPKSRRRDDDDAPRSRRRRDEDDEDDSDDRHERRRDVEDDDDVPDIRKRRRRDYDDDDDVRYSSNEARRRGKSAGVWFMVAGIVSLVMIMLSIASNLYIAARFGAGGGPNDPAVSRVAGMVFCGVVGLIGAVSHFQASAALRSFDGKGKVVTAIVFGFIFGVLFGIGVFINLALIAQVPGSGLKSLVLVAVILGTTTSFFNLFAAIKGIVTLNNPSVSREFRR